MQSEIVLCKEELEEVRRETVALENTRRNCEGGDDVEGADEIAQRKRRSVERGVLKARFEEVGMVEFESEDDGKLDSTCVGS